MWPVCSGHPTFGRVRYKEAVPPVYIRESRPKSAIVEIALPTQRKDLYVRLVLGEVAENLCVGVRMGKSGFGLFRRFVCRRVIGRRFEDNVVVRLWVLSSGKVPLGESYCGCEIYALA